MDAQTNSAIGEGTNSAWAKGKERKLTTVANKSTTMLTQVITDLISKHAHTHTTYTHMYPKRQLLLKSQTLSVNQLIVE